MKNIRNLLLTFTTFLLFFSCGSNAKNSNHIVLYAGEPKELTDPIIERFTAATGIRVDVIVAGTGEFVKRIEAEKNRPMGDVIWGGSYISTAAISDLLSPYRSEAQQKFIDQYNYLPEIGAYSPFVLTLVVNSAMISDIEIEGYQDLLNPALKGKIAFADPQKSSTSFQHLANIMETIGADDEEAGYTYIEQLIDQLDGTLLGSSNLVPQSVATGEFWVGLTYEERSMAYSKGEGAPCETIYMEEGVNINPENIYVIKNAPNEENAQKFLDFVFSKEIQQLTEDELNRRAIRDDIDHTLTPLLSEIKTVPDQTAYELANKDIWMNFFKETFTSK